MFNPPKAKDRNRGFVVNGPETGEPLVARICDLLVPPGIGSFSEYQANARLIAASPEMLDALRDLVHSVGAYKGGDIEAFRLLCNDFNDARAAIAKATEGQL